MGLDFDGFFARKRLDRVMRSFGQVTQKAKDLPAHNLREANDRARGLQTELARMQVATEKALLKKSRQDDRIERPEQCDWSYRPATWTEPMAPKGQVQVGSPQKLVGGMSLFHDCARSEISY